MSSNSFRFLYFMCTPSYSNMNFDLLDLWQSIHSKAVYESILGVRRCAVLQPNQIWRMWKLTFHEEYSVHFTILWYSNHKENRSIISGWRFIYQYFVYIKNVDSCSLCHKGQIVQLMSAKVSTACRLHRIKNIYIKKPQFHEVKFELKGIIMAPTCYLEWK